jgi:hypothetical protein
VAFTEAHSGVRGFAAGGAAAVGRIGVLALSGHLPRRVGLPFCRSYQLFIAFNAAVHASMLFPGGPADALAHVVFGIGPHVFLGLWGVVLAVRSRDPAAA